MNWLKVTIDNLKIKLIQGDITKESIDVIVNAANTTLRGGGGVDGAIHSEGGSVILQECIEKYPNGCKTGEARVTTAGLMEAKWVIHTPGPIWKGGNQGEERLLRDSYRNSILAANECGAKSIAFPSISTGVYGFAIKKASKVAVQTVIEKAKGSSIKEVHFVLFNLQDYMIYESELKRFSGIII